MAVEDHQEVFEGNALGGCIGVGAAARDDGEERMLVRH